MSESVAKATRRELRRAMGAAAVDRVVLHERAIEQHTESLCQLSDRLARRETDIESLTRLTRLHTAQLEGLSAPRSVWQRLRWLVIGR